MALAQDNLAFVGMEEQDDTSLYHEEPWCPHLEDIVYTACYCEENVYHLCQQLSGNKDNAQRELYAVFISNEARQVSFSVKSGSIH